MDTPLGPLGSLDLDDPKVCFEILAQDKHQIAEGMVVESIFDQIIELVPSAIEQKPVQIIDVDTFITRDSNDFRKAYAFVLTRTGNYPAGLGRYMIALGKVFTVYHVARRTTTHFEVREVSDGKAGAWRRLEELLCAISEPVKDGYKVSESVRETHRQLSSFWGYLQNTYGGRVKDRIALPRLLVNWGLQPWFRAVWNVDRVMLVGNEVWALEAKHKFPYGSAGALRFGLNNGEAFVIRDLIHCGIGVLHTVIVKPFWDRNTPPGYLINNLQARSQALVLGTVFDQQTIHSLLKQRSAASPDHTSITGSSTLNYKGMDVNRFHTLSSLSEPDAVATNMAKLLSGNWHSPCTEAMLQKARIRSSSS